MSFPESRYLLAVVPTPEKEPIIQAERIECSEKFHHYEALRRPVHATLFVPFNVAGGATEAQIDKLRQLVGRHPLFSLELKNFGFFEHPGQLVVFIDVVPNPVLKTLDSELSRLTKSIFGLEQRKRPPFHPHFTIGFKDLSPVIFPEVKKAYSLRQFSASFDVRHIALFKHNGSVWVLQHSFPLGANSIAQGSLW